MSVDIIENKHKEDQQSFFNDRNRYGYKLNLNNPFIRDLYFRYKKWKSIPASVPLSDQERFEFESYVMKSFFVSAAKKNPPIR